MLTLAEFAIVAMPEVVELVLEALPRMPFAGVCKCEGIVSFSLQVTKFYCQEYVHSAGLSYIWSHSHPGPRQCKAAAVVTGYSKVFQIGLWHFGTVNGACAVIESDEEARGLQFQLCKSTQLMW